MLNKTLTIASMVALVSCGGGSGGGSSANSRALALSQITVTSSTLSSSDRGLLRMSVSGGSAMTASNSTSGGEYGKSNILKIRHAGDPVKLRFGVRIGETPTVQEDVELEILETKKLSEKYIAAKLSDDRVLIMDRNDGLVKDITGYDIIDMQMKGNYLYALNQTLGRIIRIDITQDPMVTEFINNPDVPTLPTYTYPNGRSSKVQAAASWVTYDQMLSPIGNYQVPINRTRQSYLVIGDNKVLSKSTDNSFVLFEDGIAYDTLSSLGGQADFTSGAVNGGFILNDDGSFYQLRLNDIGNAAGDRLVELIFSEFNDVEGNPRNGGWIAQNLGNHDKDVTLNNVSKINENNSVIASKNNYRIDTKKRYFLTQNGFYKTDADGNGDLTFTWTDLNLSDVPVNMVNLDNMQVADSISTIVEDDYVYYKVGNEIKSIHLTSGSVPVSFASPEQNIESFKVVDGKIYYTTATGIYLVESAGAEPVLQSLEGQIEDAIGLAQ